MSKSISVTCQQCGHTTNVRVPERFEPLPTDDELMAARVGLIAEGVRWALDNRGNAEAEALIRALRTAMY